MSYDLQVYTKNFDKDTIERWFEYLKTQDIDSDIEADKFDLDSDFNSFSFSSKDQKVFCEIYTTEGTEQDLEFIPKDFDDQEPEDFTIITISSGDDALTLKEITKALTKVSKGILYDTFEGDFYTYDYQTGKYEKVSDES